MVDKGDLKIMGQETREFFCLSIRVLVSCPIIGYGMSVCLFEILHVFGIVEGYRDAETRKKFKCWVYLSLLTWYLIILVNV